MFDLLLRGGSAKMILAGRRVVVAGNRRDDERPGRVVGRAASQ